MGTGNSKYDFDSEFEVDFKSPWPKTQPELTEFGRTLLKECQNIVKPNPLELSAITENSSKFPIKFPIDSCRICSQPREIYSEIERQAASVYPIVHERVVWLYLRFLEHKILHGSDIEKEIYTGMDLPELVQRLLLKRCASFVGALDCYLLLSGEEGMGGFEEIGTTQEKHPHILRDCMSYDEMKLSAFLSISSHTQFLNDGSRRNAGKIETDKSLIEESGVIIGLIGPRVHRPNVMEYQDLVISREQNVENNGYGPNKTHTSDATVRQKYDRRQMWNEFYDEKGILFSMISENGKRFTPCAFKNVFFDNLLLKKRYTISFDTLLLESEARAAAARKRAYVHVVGIGLGVWRASQQQEEIFLETFSQRLNYLLPKLNHVSFVHFSWFHLTECGDIRDGNILKCDNHPDGGIHIFVSKRNPADKLKGPDFNNTLLIVSYAWDSNAHPGNEFWMGSLTTSSDPSTACSTLVTELHNGYINKTMVSGYNLHVASPDFGVIHIAEYAKHVLKR